MTASADQLELARESRLRSKARRQGLRLRKSRSRTPEHVDWQTFGLVDAKSNFVVSCGDLGNGLGLNLDEVEQILEER